MDYYNSLTQNVCENDMCDSVNEINSVINSVSDILPFDQLFQVGNYDNHLNDTMKGISDFKDKVINYLLDNILHVDLSLPPSILQKKENEEKKKKKIKKSD